jgi:hypothetical protein
MFTARPLARTVRSVSIRASPIFFERKMSTSTAPGEGFEVRQTSSTEDWHPDPSKSLPLDRARQALVDDIIALYSCEPTVERVKRYTPDCVYDDQFVYANDSYSSFPHLPTLLIKRQIQDGCAMVCPAKAFQGF